MFFAGQRREKIGCGHGKLFLVTGAACRYNKHVVSSKKVKFLKMIHNMKNMEQLGRNIQVTGGELLCAVS